VPLSTSPELLLDAQQARAGDQAAVDAGDTWAGLMERAAAHLAAGVLRVAGRTGDPKAADVTGRPPAGDAADGLRVLVVVGKGNNGGDGWAAASVLRSAGADVTVWSVVPLDVDLSDEAAAHRAAWRESGGRVVLGVAPLSDNGTDPSATAVGAPAIVAERRDAPDVAAAGPVRDAPDTPDVVVDCLLGTGSTGAPRGDIGTACDVINDLRAAGALVVACDVPTGVSSDTGEVAGVAVRADATVTMGGFKRGLVLHPGAAYAGRVLLGGLGERYRPPSSGADGRTWRVVTAGAARPPVLAPDADKRSRGTVLVVSGSVGQAGAAILATRGALAAGAGLVTLATPAHVQRVIAPVVPSAMTRPLRHAQEHVSADAVDQLADAGEFDAVVVGPGLGPTPGTRAVVDHLLATARCLVMDADAINVYRDDPGALRQHGGVLVLTPHARELARLGGGEDGEDAWAHRVERVPALAADLDATIVAKGPGTLVAGPDGDCWVVPVGGPELGTGGSGDVLAGMLGAALALQPDAVDGVVATLDVRVARTVFWHGFIGAWAASGRPDGADASWRRSTTAGFGPSSVLPELLPDALRVLAALGDANPAWPLEVLT
jgi:ADP-dependent NAD(P)H-hydrate dehydratase / NAD(P)H-hydrate epimerase